MKQNLKNKFWQTHMVFKGMNIDSDKDPIIIAKDLCKKLLEVQDVKMNETYFL